MAGHGDALNLTNHIFVCIAMHRSGVGRLSHVEARMRKHMMLRHDFPKELISLNRFRPQRVITDERILSK
jgi:hypothetical protein